MLFAYANSTKQLQDMTKSFPTYTFDECYVPIKYHTLIDEEKDLLVQLSSEVLVVPEVDNSILHAVLNVYMTRHNLKTPRDIARRLRVDARELSGTIHMLTGMSHEDFLHQYRFRAIRELLCDTTLSVQTIATHFGYSSIHALNRFLSDQTGGLSANMIRKNSQISTN